MIYPKPEDRYSCDVFCQNFMEIEGRLEDLEKGGNVSIEVDSELSTESTNPVQNRVITKRLNELANSGGSGGGGGPVSWNDLLDKPFYPPVASLEYNSENEYTDVVDFSTDDFTCIAKISDTPFLMEELLGKTMSMTVYFQGEKQTATQELTEETINQICSPLSPDTQSFMLSEMVFVIQEDSFNLEEAVGIPLTLTRGVWCPHGWSTETILRIDTLQILSDPGKKLDEEFLPENAATKDDLTKIIDNIEEYAPVTSVNGMGGDVELVFVDSINGKRGNVRLDLCNQDYTNLKNRPCYEDHVDIIHEPQYETPYMGAMYSHQYEGTYYLAGMWWVSNAIPTKEDVIGALVTGHLVNANQYADFYVTEDMIEDLVDGAYKITVMKSCIIVVKTGGLVIGDYTFPLAGIYFGWTTTNTGGGIQTDIYVARMKWDVVKKLDAKFLPDDIGGGSDVDLSEYYTKTETYSRDEIDEMFANIKTYPDAEGVAF